MDIQPRGFETFDELADYCHHVASVVGLSCLLIWGYRSEGGKAERLPRLRHRTAIDQHPPRRPRRRPQRADLPAPRVTWPGSACNRKNYRPTAGPATAIRDLLAFEGHRAYELLRSGTPAGSRWSTPVGRPCSAPSSASTGPCSTKSGDGTTTSSPAGFRFRRTESSRSRFKPWQHDSPRRNQPSPPRPNPRLRANGDERQNGRGRLRTRP